MPATLAKTDALRSAAKVQRIRFSSIESSANNGDVVVRFTDPERIVATSEEIEDDAVARPSSGDKINSDDLLLITGSRSARESLGSVSPAGQIEVTSHGDYVAWQPGLAVLSVRAEHEDDVVAAITYFSYYEGELRKLEQRIDELWPKAERDAALTHQVKKHDLTRTDSINELTRVVQLARMRFSRIAWLLENPDPALLSNAGRQIVSELVGRGNIENRLEAAEDRLEIFSDLYELANDRLSEFSFFWREYTLEVWILAMLVLEVVLLVIEALFISHLSGN
jgi:hypothetical protein